MKKTRGLFLEEEMRSVNIWLVVAAFRENQNFGFLKTSGGLPPSVIRKVHKKA
jgi:hypothetical protein